MKFQITRYISHVNFITKYNIQGSLGIKVKQNSLSSTCSTTQCDYSIKYSKHLPIVDDNQSNAVSLAPNEYNKSLKFQHLNCLTAKDVPSAIEYTSSRVHFANKFLKKFQNIGGLLRGERERSGCESTICSESRHLLPHRHLSSNCNETYLLKSTSVGGSQNDSNKSKSEIGQQDIKNCPICQGPLLKPDDDSCNLLLCTACGSKYCRVCRKGISALHFISPSGCGYWGQFPWTNVMWQLGMMLAAPIGVLIIADITYLTYLVGTPALVGWLIHSRMLSYSTLERSVAVFCGVLGTVIISQVTAGAAGFIIVMGGIPILLLYVYGVAPFMLVWRIISLGRDLKSGSLSDHPLARRARDVQFKTKRSGSSSGKRKP